MRIFTFFDCTPNLPDQGHIIRLWRDSWAHRGWDPKILNPRTYAFHKYHRAFKRRVDEMPCGDDPLARCRIMRWLALDAVGGGWMCDYDVMNFGPPGHPLKRPQRSRGSIIFSSEASLAYVTRRDASKIVQAFLDGANVEYAAFVVAKVYSDCYLDTHSNFGDAGWSTADTVHFGVDAIKMFLDDCFVPKHKVIENCRRTI